MQIHLYYFCRFFAKKGKTSANGFSTTFGVFRLKTPKVFLVLFRVLFCTAF